MNDRDYGKSNSALFLVKSDSISLVGVYPASIRYFTNELWIILSLMLRIAKRKWYAGRALAT